MTKNRENRYDFWGPLEFSIRRTPPDSASGQAASVAGWNNKATTMKKRIYTIWDTVANDHGPLLVFPHHAPAVRFFSDLATQPNSQIGKYPKDYALIMLGEVEINEGAPPTLSAAQLTEIVMTGEAWAAAHLNKEDK